MAALTERIELRATKSFAEKLDSWCESQPGKMSRSDAIRILVETALDQETETDFEKMVEGFGDRLRASRKAAGYRYARNFAMKLDINENCYTPYERGRMHPSPATLLRIARTLDVTSDFLLFNDERHLTVDVHRRIKKEMQPA